MNTIAVVTGAASGIGRGMAEVFIEAGMKVVMADVDETNLNTTVSALNNAGAHVLGVSTDVSQPNQVKQLAQKTLDSFGAVHVLCNRPSDVPPPPEISAEETVFVDAYKTWVASGLDPKTVGQQVLDAIKEERLYVITTNEFDDHITRRMKSIVERKNIRLPEPPKGLMDILQGMSG